ncbi:hypothetical protein GCM10011309_27880 [Litorimonas cladophorae]|uniref:Outer membrane lipoprotein Blc n=1 Tax=Litorimonas cladophorae TaxID=1220491 RepID=A0A918NJV6_9PROT|nr:lipocalin family protein [Litorimonas cladophorae]GGX76270.1 hypothetical protein GCM10011309_27880 [Litorimonas cladophorae]
MKNFVLSFLPMLALTACAGNPVAAVPVSGFETDRYLGTWYEVARLDHSFERGLSNVTANYTKRDDGKITVLNRGYNEKKGKFEDAVGKAKYASDPTTGHLKVSFFGPFYGNYIIFDLDKTDYSTAYISGGKDNYLWLLSRTPNVSDATRADFLKQSKALGYNTDSLIWVDHSRSD